MRLSARDMSLACLLSLVVEHSLCKRKVGGSIPPVGFLFSTTTQAGRAVLQEQVFIIFCFRKQNSNPKKQKKKKKK